MRTKFLINPRLFAYFANYRAYSKMATTQQQDSQIPRTSSEVVIQKLSDEERKRQLQPLIACDWAMVDDRDAIVKTFLFKNFNQAWGFMSRIAMESEKRDHHPEWSNVYNRVQITLSTHDCEGVSEKDVNLAKFIDKVAAPFLEKKDDKSSKKRKS